MKEELRIRGVRLKAVFFSLLLCGFAQTTLAQEPLKDPHVSVERVQSLTDHIEVSIEESDTVVDLRLRSNLSEDIDPRLRFIAALNQLSIAVDEAELDLNADKLWRYHIESPCEDVCEQEASILRLLNNAVGIKSAYAQSGFLSRDIVIEVDPNDGKMDRLLSGATQYFGQAYSKENAFATIARDLGFYVAGGGFRAVLTKITKKLATEAAKKMFGGVYAAVATALLVKKGVDWTIMWNEGRIEEVGAEIGMFMESAVFFLLGDMSMKKFLKKNGRRGGFTTRKKPTSHGSPDGPKPKVPGIKVTPKSKPQKETGGGTGVITRPKVKPKTTTRTKPKKEGSPYAKTHSIETAAVVSAEEIVPVEEIVLNLPEIETPMVGSLGFDNEAKYPAHFLDGMTSFELKRQNLQVIPLKAGGLEEYRAYRRSVQINGRLDEDIQALIPATELHWVKGYSGSGLNQLQGAYLVAVQQKVGEPTKYEERPIDEVLPRVTTLLDALNERNTKRSWKDVRFVNETQSYGEVEYESVYLYHNRAQGKKAKHNMDHKSIQRVIEDYHLEGAVSVEPNWMIHGIHSTEAEFEAKKQLAHILENNPPQGPPTDFKKLFQDSEYNPNALPVLSPDEMDPLEDSINNEDLEKYLQTEDFFTKLQKALNGDPIHILWLKQQAKLCERKSIPSKICYLIRSLLELGRTKQDDFDLPQWIIKEIDDFFDRIKQKQQAKNEKILAELDDLLEILSEPHTKAMVSWVPETVIESGAKLTYTEAFRLFFSKTENTEKTALLGVIEKAGLSHRFTKSLAANDFEEAQRLIQEAIYVQTVEALADVYSVSMGYHIKVEKGLPDISFSKSEIDAFTGYFLNRPSLHSRFVRCVNGEFKQNDLKWAAKQLIKSKRSKYQLIGEKINRALEKSQYVGSTDFEKVAEVNKLTHQIMQKINTLREDDLNRFFPNIAKEHIESLVRAFSSAMINAGNDRKVYKRFFDLIDRKSFQGGRELMLQLLFNAKYYNKNQKNIFETAYRILVSIDLRAKTVEYIDSKLDMLDEMLDDQSIDSTWDLAFGNFDSDSQFFLIEAIVIPEQVEKENGVYGLDTDISEQKWDQILDRLRSGDANKFRSLLITYSTNLDRRFWKRLKPHVLELREYHSSLVEEPHASTDGVTAIDQPREEPNEKLEKEDQTSKDYLTVLKRKYPKITSRVFNGLDAPTQDRVREFIFTNQEIREGFMSAIKDGDAGLARKYLVRLLKEITRGIAFGDAELADQALKSLRKVLGEDSVAFTDSNKEFSSDDYVSTEAKWTLKEQDGFREMLKNSPQSFQKRYYEKVYQLFNDKGVNNLRQINLTIGNWQQREPRKDNLYFYIERSSEWRIHFYIENDKTNTIVITTAEKHQH